MNIPILSQNSIYFKSLLIFALIFLSLNTKSQTPQKGSEIKIVYFGSSVPYGQGATGLKGYTSLFSDILKNRISTAANAWKTVNISIPGNNTIAVMNRYKADLLPQKGKYVVFALSLGNEGIHERGEPMFNQFATNLKSLIDQARSDGYIPVITNCYTRGDYNEKDYLFIKKMNLLIHSWDVPSVNLLGAVDDLSGRWANGYWADSAHPNDAGHAEMAYTIVPSLFDALETNKPMPKKVQGSSMRFSKNSSKSEGIEFIPEHIIHPFTTVISVKTKGQGALLQLKNVNGSRTISLNKDGRLVYSTGQSGMIIGTTKVNDNKWHKISITHYYAKGVTMLYCDSTIEGKVTEKLINTAVKLGGAETPKKVFYKNWLFYRSGMSKEEITYLAKDSLLKSSLELYAPLDQKRLSVSDPLINLAQSTNIIRRTIDTVGDKKKN